MISATVIAAPLYPVNGVGLDPSEVNTIGKVAVVPAGIACARLTIISPLNGVPIFLWLLKLYYTSDVVTSTAIERTAGIPPLLTLI